MHEFKLGPPSESRKGLLARTLRVGTSCTHLPTSTTLHFAMRTGCANREAKGAWANRFKKLITDSQRL